MTTRDILVLTGTLVPALVALMVGLRSQGASLKGVVAQEVETLGERLDRERARYDALEAKLDAAEARLETCEAQNAEGRKNLRTALERILDLEARDQLHVRYEEMLQHYAEELYEDLRRQGIVSTGPGAPPLPPAGLRKQVR